MPTLHNPVGDHFLHVASQPGVQQQVDRQKDRYGRSRRGLPTFLGKKHPGNAGPNERLDKETKRQGKQPAVEDALQQGRRDDPADRLDRHHPKNAEKVFPHQADGPAKRRGVDQTQQEKPQDRHHGRRSRVKAAFCNGLAPSARVQSVRGMRRRSAGDQLPNVMRAGQRHVGPAERHRRETGQKTADARAERQRTDPLHPPHVELAVPVDAVQRHVELPIGPQQRIAAKKLQRFR